VLSRRLSVRGLLPTSSLCHAVSLSRSQPCRQSQPPPDKLCHIQAVVSATAALAVRATRTPLLLLLSFAFPSCALLPFRERDVASDLQVARPTPYSLTRGPPRISRYSCKRTQNHYETFSLKSDPRVDMAGSTFDFEEEIWLVINNRPQRIVDSTI